MMRVTGDPAIGLLGLGEAGRAIGADLARAGVRVCGWDPVAMDSPEGVELVARASEVADRADVVLSLNAARAAVGAARSVSGALRPAQLYADLNTAAPASKREVAAVIEPSGALFADVALMRPVPARGLRTPALASGPGAQRFARTLGALGMPVEAIDGPPGAAAARKLVRSIFAKGLAAAIGESLAAARALGGEAEARADIAETLRTADDAFLERLVAGSRAHAARRAEEMEAATAMARELGLEPRIAPAAAAWLAELAG